MMKMNGGAIEADLFLNCPDMSVLERQKAHLNYHHPAFESTLSGFFSDIDGLLGPTGLDIPMSYGENMMESDSSNKKRKFDSLVTETKDCNEKKKRMMKNREEEEKSKLTEQNNESILKMKNKAKKEQNNGSNDSSKVTKELQKTDYIHVRARRGQATDSHSIAERVRREKISERMKYLQDLVPGCDKVTGKAGMLDEIINYVQSLQRQVEFLSMKLATVNPGPDFDMDDIFAKQVVSAPMTNLPNIVMPSPEMVNSGYIHHFNPMQQVVTNSDPLSCFNNGQASSMWDTDVQNLYSSLGV